MRTFNGDLHDLLDLVASARDYGYEDDVLFSTLAEWAGEVTDEEIRTYADTVTTTDADRTQIIQRLTEWRDRYNQ